MYYIFLKYKNLKIYRIKDYLIIKIQIKSIENIVKINSLFISHK